MQQEWAAAFAETARRYWTEDRTRELVGDRHPAILPGEAPVLLRALGLLYRDGSMPREKIRKYRQINHMLAVLQPSLRTLRDRHAVVRIVDAACGRSYLSTLIAWYFREHWKHPVQILGVDRKPALVEESRRRVAMIGLDDVLRFTASSLDAFAPSSAWTDVFGALAPGEPVFHGLVSLHGCDTVTDDALALAFQNAIEVVAVVPCCQAELSRLWAEQEASVDDSPVASIWKSGHLRRATAAHITDVYRLLLMQGAGYDAQAMEFVPFEHTPRNTLLRGVRVSSGDADALEEYRQLKRQLGGVGIGLEARLPVAAPTEAPR